MAFDDTVGQDGGDLVISFSFTPVPSITELTIDSARFDSKTGLATVMGTLACTNDGVDINLFVDLREALGRTVTIEGSQFVSQSVICDGTPQPWSVPVLPFSGRFGGGKGLASAQIQTCNAEGACGFVVATTETIQMRGGGK